MPDLADAWGFWTLAGLGLFHGLNPAMGWLFSVALGLHRGSPRILLLSLLPIALGHAAAVAAAVAVILTVGTILDVTVAGRLVGAALLAWVGWLMLVGHGSRPRIGMRTGLAGLALWSFLMANAHGAGLMLGPVVLPICRSAASGAALDAAASWPLALMAIGVHTAAMLATIATVAWVVYRWVGVAFLRRGWINFDLIWIAALTLCGTILLVS